MQRLLLPSLLVLGLFCTPIFGQPVEKIAIPGKKIAEAFEKKEIGKKKESGTASELSTGIPGEVDVHFFNGSTVRMIVHSEKLEIATLYGKLAVPVKDVRAIEFGLHFPEGAVDRIGTAIKSLGGNNYQEREEASKTLVELGPFSYPAVFEASREKDAEVSRRAQDVIKKLQAKFPKTDLKSSVDDRVITGKFTIVGQILTPTIKAKTDYFGEVELSLAKMRNLRAVGGPSLETIVSLDASKYSTANQWMDTKFRVEGKTGVTITAKGVVDVCPNDNPGLYLVGPTGFQASRNGGGRVFAGGAFGPGGVGRKIGVINQNHGGMLIGKIGEDGEPFYIGDSFDGIPEADGNLFLHIGPSPFNGASSGAFEVKINRKN